MKDRAEKKILVTVDGSKRSLETIRHITKNEIFHDMKIVLFHVFAGVPESYFDIERKNVAVKTLSSVRAWEIQQKKIIAQHMELLHIKLQKAGIPEENITVKIQKMKKGIARDIIQEAQNGYMAVVSRRRGIGAIRGVVIGSVATKLIEKLSFVPLILVGKKPSGNRILIGCDGSEGAIQATKFVGMVCAGYDYRICLANIIRGTIKTDQEIIEGDTLSKQISSKAELINQQKLTEAKNLLIKAGMNENQINIKVVSGAFSRAKALDQTAKKDRYGIIALGRRGLTRTRDFFMGRVTNKIIHMARDRTVWIIR